MQTATQAAVARSICERALVADVPSHASTGVRNQKIDKAAIRKSAKRTEIRPRPGCHHGAGHQRDQQHSHAPCSRGTTIAFSLEFCKLIAGTTMQ
jgi:hypothetical protein